MNISEMGDMEKSIVLARLAWRERAGEVGAVFCDDKDSIIWGYPFCVSLYRQENFHTVWRALTWALKTRTIGPDLFRYLFSPDGRKEVFGVSPVDAQRAIIDKILELAIEAGLIRYRTKEPIDD
jgi:hypothetical protein